MPVRCLAFEAKSLSVRKVRPLSILCRLDLCQQAVHMSSQREDSCKYAHSAIELKTWMVQRHTGGDRHWKYNHQWYCAVASQCFAALILLVFTGVSHSEIVKISTKYYEQTFYGDEGNKVRTL